MQNNEELTAVLEDELFNETESSVSESFQSMALKRMENFANNVPETACVIHYVMPSTLEGYISALRKNTSTDYLHIEIMIHDKSEEVEDEQIISDNNHDAVELPHLSTDVKQNLNELAKAIRDHIKQNPNLCRVIIAGYDELFSDDDLIIILEAIAHHPNITHLNLDELKSQDLSAIIKMLNQNKRIYNISFSGSKLNLVESQYFLEQFSEVIKHSTSLGNFKLSNFNMDSNSFQKLAKAVEVNVSLKHFDVEYNVTTVDEAKSIAKVIEKNKLLLDINFHGYLSTVAVQIIAEALKQNKTITALVFVKDFSEQGMQAIADMLKVNTALQDLLIFNLNISTRKYQLLAEALTINRTLTRLEVLPNQNQLGSSSIDEPDLPTLKAFADALEYNTRIKLVLFKVTKYYTKPNALYTFDENRIYEYLARNSNLVKLSETKSKTEIASDSEVASLNKQLKTSGFFKKSTMESDSEDELFISDNSTDSENEYMSSEESMELENDQQWKL